MASYLKIMLVHSDPYIVLILGSLPQNGHSTMNSSGDLDRIIIDRPDTNTFIAHSTPTNGYNTVTLGRKTSTLSWAGGSPRSRSFRSLGRNGTMSLLHTPSSSKRHINDYGRSPTPHLNVSCAGISPRKLSS